MWQNLITQNVTKLKNSKCDKTQNVKKLKMRQNSKTQNLTFQNITKLKNSKFDKTEKTQMWQNAKTKNVTKLKNYKCNKTGRGVNSNWTKYLTSWGNAFYVLFAGHLSKTTIWAFKVNALGNKCPVDYFLVWQHFWAIPGVWSGPKMNN